MYEKFGEHCPAENVTNELQLRMLNRLLDVLDDDICGAK